MKHIETFERIFLKDGYLTSTEAEKLEKKLNYNYNKTIIQNINCKKINPLILDKIDKHIIIPTTNIELKKETCFYFLF